LTRINAALSEVLAYHRGLLNKRGEGGGEIRRTFAERRRWVARPRKLAMQAGGGGKKVKFWNAGSGKGEKRGWSLEKVE